MRYCITLTVKLSILRTLLPISSHLQSSLFLVSAHYKLKIFGLEFSPRRRAGFRFREMQILVSVLQTMFSCSCGYCTLCRCKCNFTSSIYQITCCFIFFCYLITSCPRSAILSGFYSTPHSLCILLLYHQKDPKH